MSCRRCPRAWLAQRHHRHDCCRCCLAHKIVCGRAADHGIPEEDVERAFATGRKFLDREKVGCRRRPRLPPCWRQLAVKLGHTVCQGLRSAARLRAVTALLSTRPLQDFKTQVGRWTAGPLVNLVKAKRTALLPSGDTRSLAQATSLEGDASLFGRADCSSRPALAPGALQGTLPAESASAACPVPAACLRQSAPAPCCAPPPAWLQWPFNPDSYLGYRGPDELQTVTGAVCVCVCVFVWVAWGVGVGWGVGHGGMQRALLWQLARHQGVVQARHQGFAQVRHQGAVQVRCRQLAECQQRERRMVLSVEPITCSRLSSFGVHAATTFARLRGCLVVLPLLVGMPPPHAYAPLPPPVAGNRLWEWFSVGRWGTLGYNFGEQRFEGEQWPAELGALL